jgi:hypothetical protein
MTFHKNRNQKVVAASMQIMFNFVINDTMNKFTYNLDIFLVDIRIIYSKIIYAYTFFCATESP